MTYLLVATYPFKKAYDYCYVVDVDLSKVVRRESDGAGTDLISHVRDVTWSFNTRQGAENAAKRLRRLRRLKGLQVTVEKTDY